MNYSELVIAIQSYTENQFPAVYLADGSTENYTAQINRFIQQAEQRRIRIAKAEGAADGIGIYDDLAGRDH